MAYADDITAVTVTWNTEDAQMRINQVMQCVRSGLQKHGLNLGHQKKNRNCTTTNPNGHCF